MLKDIIKRYRGLLHIVAYTYNVLHRNNSWKYSIGSNKILNRGVFLNGVKFKIKGANNKIIIGEKARLNNCEVLWKLGVDAQLFQIHSFGYKMIIVLFL